MNVLSRESLPLGGFAGLTEHRLVTDKRVFGARKSPNTFDGIGSFVYLADAKFNPLGETGMHPHKEIDVISVMIEGRVSHEGSLEHGNELLAGDVQVQRAGGEGFSHNEVNPDKQKNRMIQLWVLPETLGEKAGYKHYSPKKEGVTRIYGGQQPDTFTSKTQIDIVRLKAGAKVEFEQEVLAYVTAGQGEFIENEYIYRVKDGDLLRGNEVITQAESDLEVIVITHNG